jgi:hypothetical protein
MSGIKLPGKLKKKFPVPGIEFLAAGWESPIRNPQLNCSK